jgi:hypothetical protein
MTAIRAIARCAGIAAVCVLAAWGRSPAALEPSTTTCERANPYDELPDHVALQECLDNYDHVLLKSPTQPGYVGYLIGDTIKLKRSGGLLGSGDSPRKAVIVAAPDLSSSMVRGLGVDNFELSFIVFDGNRDARLPGVRPCDDLRNYRNVELSGNGLRVRYVESKRAVCGSAMTLGDSADFQIYGTFFYDNGAQPEDANGVEGFWADGLTVFKCIDAVIRDNYFWDNTDVDLGVNGGARCSVYRNKITHTNRYGFAGLVAGDPSRTGGEFSDNTISSARNMLGFGLLIGCHPWAQCGGGYVSGLSVHNNHVTGAVVNLAVDGVNGGSVRNNTMSGAQGTRLPNCPGTTADYTVGHAIDVAPLQTGYVVHTFDFGQRCQ